METPGRLSIDDEKALVGRAARGDSQAFERLLVDHQRYAYNLALRALGDPHEAEDITQEAFLKAWQALPRFQGKARFGTWLYRIVVNLCYDRLPGLRREMQAQESGEELESLPDEPMPFPGIQAGEDPERSALARERARSLQAHVEALPNGYGVMILLRYVMAYRYEEIASVLDVPIGTVKTGLHRARKLLRAALLAEEQASL